ncbi:NAD(P)/FAD-dependent oxidoreductase [bacterium]|nr:NAD(P)/FAD-dependent oxidoreductase [bacterium]
MSKKVLIIGGGIAGLSAGYFLKKSGYEPEIFEHHAIAGGLVTAWKRKGYTFEGCIHWLVGSSPDDPGFRKLWEELGYFPSIEIVDHEIFTRIEGNNGEYLNVYSDADRFQQELLRVSPEDKKYIIRFIKGVKKLSKWQMRLNPPASLMSGKEKMKMMAGIVPFMGEFRKWSKLSVSEYASNFKSDFLKKAFKSILGMGESMIFILMTLAWLHRKNAGYPIGGSLKMIGSIENKYKKLGGKIRFNSTVKKIIVENDTAVGIILENGEEIRGDIVISAADGHSTLFEMLPKKYLTDEFRDYYSGGLEPFPAIIQVSLGIESPCSGMPGAVQLYLNEPLRIDPKTTANELGFRFFHFDPTMAPEGKTAANALMHADFDYWYDLRQKNDEKYRQEKDRIAEDIIRILDNRFPGISEKIEVKDIATPATYYRYTLNWNGSMEGWLPNARFMLEEMKKELPGLKNFHMIGQWVAPGGGLPPSASAGLTVTQKILASDGKDFRIL